MLELIVEKYLVDQVEAAGGDAPKFNSEGRRDQPDRLCLLPQGRVLFVETKAPGEVPRDTQMDAMRDLADLGFDVCWVDCKTGVDHALQGRSSKFVHWVSRL